MSIHRRTAMIVVARHMHQYRRGDKVRILRGKYAGREMIVEQPANDWLKLQGTPSREFMSKGNVEPVTGFSEEELNQAKRAAEKMQGLGSLI